MRLIPSRLRELWRDLRCRLHPPAPVPGQKNEYIAVLWKGGKQRTFKQVGDPSVAIVVPVVSAAEAVRRLAPGGPSLDQLDAPIFAQERYLRRYTVITDSWPGDGGMTVVAVYQHDDELYPWPVSRAHGSGSPS